MNLRKFFRSPFTWTIIWPIIYSITMLFVVPWHILLGTLSGMWRGFNEGGKKANFYLFEFYGRPWVIIPKAWRYYNRVLDRKRKIFKGV